MPVDHNLPPTRACFDTAAFHRITTEQGISQRTLARLIGVNRASIIRWAHGRAQPSPRLLRDMATALGVTPADLYRPGSQGPDLAYFRVLAGWSGNALAAKVGVSNTILRAVEAGLRLPPAPLQARLRELLGIDAATWDEARRRAPRGHIELAGTASPQCVPAPARSSPEAPHPHPLLP